MVSGLISGGDDIGIKVGTFNTHTLKYASLEDALRLSVVKMHDQGACIREDDVYDGSRRNKWWGWCRKLGQHSTLTHASLSFELHVHLPRFWCEHMPPNFGINFSVNTSPQIFNEPTIP